MSILSRTSEENAPDYSVSQDVGGNHCDLVLCGNLNETHPVQQDRASVVEIPGIDAGQFPKQMQRAFAVMHERASAATKHIDGFNGGSTGTILLYDPKKIEIAVGSKGDSPAYLLLEHKGATSLVRISSDRTKTENGWLLNSINYFADKYEYTRTDIRKVAKEVMKGVDPQDIKYTVILGSDGIFESVRSGAPETLKGFADALAGQENPAQAAIAHTLAQGSKDNLSVVTISDIKPGKGGSVALCVCDGHRNHGHYVAEAGIQAFQEVMQNIKRMPGAEKRRLFWR